MNPGLVDSMLIAMHQHSDNPDFNLSNYIIDHLEKPNRDVRRALNDIVHGEFAIFRQGNPQYHPDFDFKTNPINGKLTETGRLRVQAFLSQWTRGNKLMAILHCLSEGNEQNRKTFFSSIEIRRKVFNGLITKAVTIPVSVTHRFR